MPSTRPPTVTSAFPKAIGGRVAPMPGWLRGAEFHEPRARFFDAGVNLIGKPGRCTPTVDEIIREAGVSRGTFYNHFDDIFSFIQFLFDEIQVRLIGAVDRANAAIADPAERLARAVVVCIEYAERYPREVQILARFSRAQLAPDSPLSRKFSEELIAAMVTGCAQDCALETAVCVFVGTTSTAMFVIADSQASRDNSRLASEVTCALLQSCGVDPHWSRSSEHEGAANDPPLHPGAPEN